MHFCFSVVFSFVLPPVLVFFGLGCDSEASQHLRCKKSEDPALSLLRSFVVSLQKDEHAKNTIQGKQSATYSAKIIQTCAHILVLLLI